jgi:DNA (cytosine-5)-methyltransferase 1
MRYCDLFAGVGGFRYGIEQVCKTSDALGIAPDNRCKLLQGVQSPKATCVYSNEWDKYANSVYKKHYGECDNRDIREVKAEEIPEFDLLCGGFPCQSFSIAGKRGGFQDTRGTLFFEIARIAKQKQPRLLLLENVKGLLSHDKGNTFATIISTLDELGYDCQWQVLNSKNFGVPQNRERVFIVGHLRGTSRPKVFPITGSNGQNRLSNHAIAWSKSHRTGKAPEDFKRKNYGKTELRIKRGEFNTINTGDGGGNQSTQNYVDKTKIRKLTPTECERLQGFPDDWTKYGHEGQEISDTQRYKMMGNAVTTNVVSAIVSKLFSSLQ